MPRFPRATIPAALLACAALPAPLLHQALAATAGTLFEAAPFVLAVALVRGPAMRWSAALLGCGCGSSAGFAALSLPAAALCWTVFGPWPALARFAMAVLLQRIGSRRLAPRHETVDSDPLEQLCAVGICAWFVALAQIALEHVPASATGSASAGGFLTAGELLAGAALGMISPCTTAAVAMAAMLRGPAPLAALGILTTAGLVPSLRFSTLPANVARDARASIALLAIACLVLALRDGAGFVHPRLVPLLWLAVPATMTTLFVRPLTRAPYGALVPIAMLVALVFGSPIPQVPLSAGAIDDLYPSEPIAFTGTVHSARGSLTLLRYAITCCRADATAIALPTDIRTSVEDGAWLSATGTVERDGDGMYLRVARWSRAAAPADPFVYR